MINELNMKAAGAFLDAVRAHDSVGKGVVNQMMEAARAQGETLPQCAARVGVMVPHLLQFADGTRDLGNVGIELLYRVSDYLELDVGVLQIATGRLTVGDFRAMHENQPCSTVQAQVSAWQGGNYAFSLFQLAAEYQGASPDEPIVVTSLPVLSERLVAERCWLSLFALQIRQGRENALLSWVTHTGLALSCTPDDFCRCMDMSPRFSYELFVGRQPPESLGRAELMRIAGFLGIPAAAAFAAAGQLACRMTPM